MFFVGSASFFLPSPLFFSNFADVVCVCVHRRNFRVVFKPFDGIRTGGGNFISICKNLCDCGFYQLACDSFSAQGFINKCVIYSGDTVFCRECDFGNYPSIFIFRINAGIFCNHIHSINVRKKLEFGK